MANSVDSYFAETLNQWKKWLLENHSVEESVWLVFYKKATGKSSLTVSEAIQEALCFGWIDSKKKSRDSESYLIYFTRRNPKSNWSRVNKDTIAKMEKEGRMQLAGIKMVELAKKSGTWDALNDVENLLVPRDLKEAFDKIPNSLARFESHPPGVRRASLHWVFNAKKSETRLARIEKLVEKSARGERVL